MAHRRRIPLISAVLLVLLVLFGPPAPTFAQQGGDLMSLGEKVDEDYLELAGPVVAIWPDISQEAVEAINESLAALIANCENELQDADAHESELKDLVEEAKKNEDIVKAKVDVAKKAEDEAEKVRLEALKATHKQRREYLDKIRKIREQEKKVSEARIDYYESLQTTVEKALELSNARQGEKITNDLLDKEGELIKQAKETAKLNDKAAGEAKKLMSMREDAFKQRQKIFEEMERVESESK